MSVYIQICFNEATMGQFSFCCAIFHCDLVLWFPIYSNSVLSLSRLQSLHGAQLAKNLGFCFYPVKIDK